MSPEGRAALAALLRREYGPWLRMELHIITADGAEQRFTLPCIAVNGQPGTVLIPPAVQYSGSAPPPGELGPPIPSDCPLAEPDLSLSETVSTCQPWQYESAVLAILLQAASSLTQEEILDALRAEGVDISLRTLSRHLRRMELSGVIRHLPRNGYLLP